MISTFYLVLLWRSIVRVLARGLSFQWTTVAFIVRPQVSLALSLTTRIALVKHHVAATLTSTSTTLAIILFEYVHHGCFVATHDNVLLSLRIYGVLACVLSLDVADLTATVSVF
jgi:hypothetical protein